ncbi:hypothetical protein Tco_0381726, partial [Tanacetum coccineum]
MFGSKSTAEDVTQGINGSGLDAIVTRVMAPPFTLSKDKIKLLQFAMNHIGFSLPLMKFSKTSYQYYPICFDMKTVEIDIINSIDNDIEDVKGQ